MRERVQLKVPRTRLRIEQPRRSNDYLRLRRYWLNEICWLKAKRRNGTATIKDIRAAQRALAKVRENNG